MRIQRFTTAGLALATTALFVAACSSGSSSSSSGSGLSGTLNASGSTLQLVYEQQAIQSFKSVQPSMTVNYGGGGSGKGRTDLASNVVQFAGSDSPISSDDLPLFKGKTVLYFPILISPITVSFNLSGVSNLKLDAPVIADIFQAKITKWNDPAIAALNPGMKLPSAAITIAHRSDSSGTTQNFSEFLVEGAPGVWKLGSDSTINWPANSQGGNGNSGVAQIIKQTPGAVGYVDYADAKASQLTFASIKNKDGNYIAPSVQAASEAASNAQLKPDLTFSAIWRRRPVLPDYRSVVGAGLPEAVELEHHEDAQGVHRLPRRRRPETAPRAGLRDAALQHRPAGQGAAQQDRFVSEPVVTVTALTRADQEGSWTWGP
jgi:phosphate transport system substrate-binding protein